jgi:hypothetical protein
MHWFLKFILEMKLYMFRTVPLSIIRSYSLYTQRWYMSYRFVDSFRAGSGWNCSSILILLLLESCLQTCIVPSWSWCCSKAVYKPVWHIPLLSVQCITPDDGQRNCPKLVEFHFQNKYEKLVHLVDLIIKKQEYIMYFNHTKAQAREHKSTQSLAQAHKLDFTNEVVVKSPPKVSLLWRSGGACVVKGSRELCWQ